MSEDSPSPLPWTPQQWASIRAAAQESARNARVASSFLPLTGPLPPDQTTVPALWMKEGELDEYRQRGEAPRRLWIDDDRVLHLITISANVYLRGAEVADPELAAAKAMVRRAAEVLGRLEDAIVFNGRKQGEDYPKHGAHPVVQPVVYTVSEGHGRIGLLDAPDELHRDALKEKQRAGKQAQAEMKGTYDVSRKPMLEQRIAEADAARSKEDAMRKAVGDVRTTEAAVRDAEKAQSDSPDDATLGPKLQALQAQLDQRRAALDDLGAAELPERMCVPIAKGTDNSPIVGAVVRAVEKLENVGHYGPFTVVLGHQLFNAANTPNVGSLVLPSDRIIPFLEGGRLLRSSTLPPEDGVVVALAGAPVELVVARDMDVQFVQMTLEPRYVLRVFEKFVLRIKQLDAVCRITSGTCFRDPE